MSKKSDPLRIQHGNEAAYILGYPSAEALRMARTRGNLPPGSYVQEGRRWFYLLDKFTNPSAEVHPKPSKRKRSPQPSPVSNNKETQLNPSHRSETMTGSTRCFYIIAGGTFEDITPHWSFASRAFGRVGVELTRRLNRLLPPSDRVMLIQTKMSLGLQVPSKAQAEIMERAGIETLLHNDDIEILVRYLTSLSTTRCIVLTSAVCDFAPKHLRIENTQDNTILHESTEFGKDVPRLDTGLFGNSDIRMSLEATPTEKIIRQIRRERKDIFVVGFKATTGKTKRECYIQGIDLLKSCSANLVLANDIREHHNLVVTPEEYPYNHATREDALDTLAQMIRDRTSLTFVRTEVVLPDRVNLEQLYMEQAIPTNFVPVLLHLIESGAFPVFRGATAGHFGCKILPMDHNFQRISSVRKADHNKVFEEGMVGIVGFDTGRILSSGGKPSVGENTQRAIYSKYGERVHSIIHVHCPLKKGSQIPEAFQKPFECGSKECATNTVDHMKEMRRGLYAVHLKGHGPNIAFHKDIPADEVIRFISENIELDKKMGGPLHGN